MAENLRELDEQRGQAESRLAAKCFNLPYQGRAHEELYHQVGENRGKVQEAVHYSVYAAFVQTSGFGKTRAVLEMACLDVYICYCSLAAKGSSAFPPRTELLADSLSQASSEIEMVLYLKAWLLVLHEELKRDTVTAKQWKETFSTEFTRVEVAQGLPVLTVVMSLREAKMPQDSTNWILWDDLPHVTCYGIQHNYDYLSPQVKRLLESILVTVPDPMLGASKEQAEWIKQMLPERFEKALTFFRQWN